MNSLGFLWWKLGKKTNRPTAATPQKPDHNPRRIFASPTQLHIESQKSRYDISTNKSGHGEQIGKCTAKSRAATNCMPQILTKRRRKKRLGVKGEEMMDIFILSGLFFLLFLSLWCTQTNFKIQKIFLCVYFWRHHREIQKSCFSPFIFF